MSEKQLTEQESLKLITEMIHKAKSGKFHESGVSAILWGSVVGAAGLINFAEIQWQFSIGFDIWIIVLAAIIPQVFISVSESKKRKVTTYQQGIINTVWLIYGISIFCLVFYSNVVPNVTEKFYVGQHILLSQKNELNGEIKPFHPFIFSLSSLFLILYAIPTLITGLAFKFKPMIAGGIICYLLFIFSCFTVTKYDLLMNGVAGILNWFIPGMILNHRYRKALTANV
jgi:hypothetical protein